MPPLLDAALHATSYLFDYRIATYARGQPREMSDDHTYSNA